MEFIYTGTVADNGRVIGVRATDRVCVYYWYFENGQRVMSIVQGPVIKTINFVRKEPVILEYHVDDNDVVDSNGVRYIDSTVLHAMFVNSMAHCNMQ